MEAVDSEQNKKLVDELLQTAKTVLQRDGYHHMMIFILKDGQMGLVPQLSNMEKYEYTGMVSYLAEKVDADFIVTISESFMSQKDIDDPAADDPKFRPSEDPDRREALMVGVSNCYGNCFIKAVFFKKIEEQIVFEEEEVLQNGQLSLVPPWKEPTKH